MLYFVLSVRASCLYFPFSCLQLLLHPCCVKRDDHPLKFFRIFLSKLHFKVVGEYLPTLVFNKGLHWVESLLRQYCMWTGEIPKQTRLDYKGVYTYKQIFFRKIYHPQLNQTWIPTQKLWMTSFSFILEFPVRVEGQIWIKLKVDTTVVMPKKDRILSTDTHMNTYELMHAHWHNPYRVLVTLEIGESA